MQSPSQLKISTRGKVTIVIIVAFQVGQMKDVPGTGQVAEVEVDGKIQV